MEPECTGWLICVLGLQLFRTKINGQLFVSLLATQSFSSYQTTGGRLVGALAGHLEGDIVWGIALDLKGSLV